MSMPRGTKITCPKCGVEGNFTIWHSVNVDVNPETREKVKNGKLFEYKCKNCGDINHVEYRFLYHDTNNNFMIWYFPNNEYDIYNEINEVNNIDLLSLARRKIRMVDNKRSLIEKIHIFEDGLNDIVIELLKKMILINIEDKTVEVFYKGMHDDSLDFWLSNQKGCLLPCSMYDKVKKDFIIEEPKECAIINQSTVFKYAESKGDSN